MRYSASPRLVLLMILVPCCRLWGQPELSSPRRLELMGAYAFNTDFVPDRPVLIVADQKVSPFFSNGSGPFGFEASIKRYVWNGLGIKATISGYFDPFFEGSATYCQPGGCALNVDAKASPRTFYGMLGPEWKFRRTKRLSPFLQAVGGFAYTRSTFNMSGSNVQFANGYRGGGLIVINSSGFPINGDVKYSDFSSDIGLALGIGGGFDTRLTKRLSFRVSMSYDPTFLVRPVITNPTLIQPIPSARSRQDHVALSLGLVWGIQ